MEGMVTDSAVLLLSILLHVLCGVVVLHSPEERWLRTSIASSRDPRKPSLGFDATSAREFAEILCCLDYKLYRRIPVRRGGKGKWM